jgi:hypothetical protein
VKLYNAVVQSAAANVDTGRGRITQYSFRAFWILYVLAGVVCMLSPEGRIFLGSLGMAVYWFLVVRFRDPLRKPISRMIPSFNLRFFVIGIVSSDLIMENLAINFKGDLHHNLFLNSLMWLGSYIGSIVGWWVIARTFRFTPYQVFFLAGLLGVIIEQNWMIPKLLAAGSWAIALLCAPIILVVYGAAVAPAFLLAGDPPRTPARKPGIASFAIALLLPALLFYCLGGLWIAVLRPFVGS